MMTMSEALRPLWAMHGFRRTTGEAIADAAEFGVIVEPVIDLTVGAERGFWTDHKPKRLVTNDASLEVPADYHIDLLVDELPLPARRFGTAVFDPPYRMSGRADRRDGLSDRFGVDRYRGRGEIWSLYEAGVAEAIRLSNHWVIVKCQDQTSSGVFQGQSHHIWEVALDHRARLEFVMFVVGVPRKQPAGRGVRRPQANVSQLMVFQVPR